ncbi:unnamed protein product, partial [Ectocarpus sp. 12 AP-2014]
GGRAGVNQAVGSTSRSNKDPTKSALDTESISFSALPLLVGRTQGESSFGDTLRVSLLLYLRVIRSYVLTVEQQSHNYAIVASFSSSTTHFYDGGPDHTATRGRDVAAQRLLFSLLVWSSRSGSISLSLSLARTRLEEKDPSTPGADRDKFLFGLTFLALISRQPAGNLQLCASPQKRAMRRSRNAPPKGDEGGDDSGQMVVGTGVTMDFSAMDDSSLTVVVRGVMRHAVLKTENVIVTGRLHGNVEAKTLEISKGALFLGKAMVGSATVAGRLEGILVVGDMLTMRSSGHCDGVLRYGQLNVQHGGKLTGAVKTASPADVGIGDIPVPDLPPGTWDDFWG